MRRQRIKWLDKSSGTSSLAAKFHASKNAKDNSEREKKWTFREYNTATQEDRWKKLADADKPEGLIYQHLLHIDFLLWCALTLEVE